MTVTTAPPVVAPGRTTPPGMHPAPARAVDSGDLYRELFQHAGVAMAVLDRHGRIRQVNGEFRALIDRPHTALIGQPFWTLAGGEHGDALRGAFHGLTAGVNRLSADALLPRAARPTLRCRVTVARIPERAQLGGGTRTAGAPAPGGGALLSLTAARNDRPDLGQSLRPIERDVLCHVAAGATTARVAAATHLSRQGVDYNLRTLMERFSAGNRAELVARAYTTGVLAEGSWPPRLAGEAPERLAPRPHRTPA